MTINELKHFLINLNGMPENFPDRSISRIHIYKLICNYESAIHEKMNCLIKSSKTDQLVGGYFWSPKTFEKLKKEIGMSERHIEIQIL